MAVVLLRDLEQVVRRKVVARVVPLVPCTAAERPPDQMAMAALAVRCTVAACLRGLVPEGLRRAVAPVAPLARITAAESPRGPARVAREVRCMAAAAFHRGLAQVDQAADSADLHKRDSVEAAYRPNPARAVLVQAESARAAVSAHPLLAA